MPYLPIVPGDDREAPECTSFVTEPTVWDDDPNPVIGTLLDSEGFLLLIVRARPERRLGYY